MSALASSNLALVKLYGALESTIWLCIEAEQSIDAPSPLGDPALRDDLLRIRLALTRAQGLCLNHAVADGEAR
jgi:hypothetical protein